ncbi:hypothetical protein O181_018346 [Austropuccinia psidii MF-1]|uniref:Uncharacterized protein n=1 Tax=Austropuccinia psidii MF-1 TaxID=1389203 RepID=A0A9Q3GSV7_9BASI|nr:hypothetical protein [Austropuccinia psidii MF-1]
MDPLESRNIGQVWPWGTPMTPMDHKPLNAEYGPWSTDHSTWKGQKGPKRAKKAPNHNLFKNGHSNSQEPKCSIWSRVAKGHFSKPSLKDNWDKTPPRIMPNFNWDEEDPRGPTG